MHPELAYVINVQRNSEMRDRAAAWRRAKEARAARKCACSAHAAIANASAREFASNTHTAKPHTALTG
jgi:hypothetical protein